MESIRRFLNQRRILVFFLLLLVLLAVSMTLNMYLYFEATKPSDKNEHWWSAFMGRTIQGGMGSISVYIDKGLYLGVGYEFNVSVGIGLWEPYLGSTTYHFTFRLYERDLHGEYSDSPTAEKNVTVQKHKDRMAVNARATFNVTAPSDPGIYIYRAVIQGSGYDYALEFPILVELGGPIIGPIVPSV